MKPSPVQLTFIALLTLLQIVAPLVHAHTGYDDFSAAGIHLPGLEYYTPYDTHKSVASAEHSNDQSGVLVTVGSGVEKKRIKSTPSCDTAILISLCMMLIAAQMPPQRIAPPTVSHFPSPPFNTAAPVRAPPASSLS